MRKLACRHDQPESMLAQQIVRAYKAGFWRHLLHVALVAWAWRRNSRLGAASRELRYEASWRLSCTSCGAAAVTALTRLIAAAANAAPSSASTKSHVDVAGF